jgi:hypothetical protein
MDMYPGYAYMHTMLEMFSSKTRVAQPLLVYRIMYTLLISNLQLLYTGGAHTRQGAINHDRSDKCT